MPEAYQVVVRLGVALVEEVHVVGGDDLGARLRRQPQDALVDHLLLFEHVAVAAGLVGPVALQLEVEVVAEKILEPEHGALDLLVVVGEQGARNLAGETGGGDDDALVVLLQQGVVDA